MIKKIIIIILLATLSSFNSRAENPYKFKVGLILTLSGEWAEYGIAQENSIKLAIADNPSKFSNIKFFIEDSEYSTRKIISSFNKLIDQDKVDIVFIWGVEPARIIAPIAERKKTPLAVSAIIPNTAIGSNYVFRTINYDKQYALKLLEYLEKEKRKKIAIFKSQLAYHDILVNALIDNASKSMKFEVIADVLPNDSDFRTYPNKIINKNFDSIGVFLSPRQIIQLLNNLNTYKIKLPLFGPQTFQSKSLNIEANGRLENAIFVHNYVEKDFYKKYLTKYKNDHQIPWGANAYDFALLTSRLFSNITKKPTAKEIIKKFSSIQSGHGAGGSYNLVNLPETGLFFDYQLSVQRITSIGYKTIK